MAKDVGPARETHYLTPAREKPSSFCGRKVERCDCISSKTLYIIALVVGLVLLVAGILALVGHCLPDSPLGAILSRVATQTGTNPLLLVSFSLSLGAALTFAGAFGLRYGREEAKPLPPPIDDLEDDRLLTDTY